MLVLSQYHIFESYKTNIYRAFGDHRTHGAKALTKRGPVAFIPLSIISATFSQNRKKTYEISLCLLLCYLGFLLLGTLCVRNFVIRNFGIRNFVPAP
jgi:hypothetical protein